MKLYLFCENLSTDHRVKSVTHNIMIHCAFVNGRKHISSRRYNAWPLQIRGRQIPNGLQPETVRVHGPRLWHGRYAKHDDYHDHDHNHDHNHDTTNHIDHDSGQQPGLERSAVIEDGQTEEMARHRVRCAQWLPAHTGRALLRTSFCVQILRWVTRKFRSCHRYNILFPLFSLHPKIYKNTFTHRIRDTNVR